MNVKLPKNFKRKALFLPDTKGQSQNWEPPTIDNTAELTLLDAIEQIAALAINSELCNDFYELAQRPLQYLSERMKLEIDEVLIFSVIFNMYYDNQITQQDIGRFLNIPPLYLLRVMTSADELLRRRWICRRKTIGNKCFYIPSSTINAIVYDTIPQCNTNSDLTLEEWFAELNAIISERKSNDCLYDDLILNMENLVKSNNHLHFVKMLEHQNLNADNTAIFLWVCDMIVNEQEKEFEVDDIWQLFNDRHKLIRIKNSMRSGMNALIKQGLIQPVQDILMVKDKFELSNKVKTEMMMGLNLKFDSELDHLINHTTIKDKPMFYNPKEKELLDRLTELLSPIRYDEICQRLAEKGMRKNFTCLFYGSPGTGKTETALQIAKATGRHLMPVNISEIKSKWVGDSEKNVKKIFEHYRELVQKMDIAPILFFNEADAIINKRMENALRSVDKMENTVQNIILQEIENLEGILIATTNLTQNFDKAFERRFLYKIEFTKPSQETKSRIWRSMIPELSQNDACILATYYDFSGGQIENIARKQIIENIISGQPLSLTELRHLCDAEVLEKSSLRRVVGF